VAAEIEVVDVEDFEAGLLHGLGPGGGHGGVVGGEGVGEEGAFGVVEDVEFVLAGAGVEEKQAAHATKIESEGFKLMPAGRE
jgi:hypothetical protein